LETGQHASFDVENPCRLLLHGANVLNLSILKGEPESPACKALGKFGRIW